jgi:hypothetical protein
MSEPVAVRVAKAALCEAGRPDIASLIEATRDAMPTLHPFDADRLVDGPDPVLTRRAFLLGHLAAGHVNDHQDDDEGGICCGECSCDMDGRT